MARLTKAEEAERKECIETLRALLPPGTKVYTILRYVSKSGMMREISFKAINGDGDIMNLDYYVSRVVGDPIGEHDGVRVTGCGMDMGFHLVYVLSRHLYPDGFGVPSAKKGIRPATKEEAARLVKRGLKFHGRNGDASGWDDNGGYALRQVWL